MANTKYRSLSRNVLTDEGALEELLALGTRQLPVISRGKDWVNGQSLKEIARLVGIDLGIIRHLPPAELVRRIDVVVDGASRFFAQIPRTTWTTSFPVDRVPMHSLPGTCSNVVDAFLEHEEGIALQATAYNRVPAPGTTGQQILAYGGDVRQRFAAWWQSALETRTDWNNSASVYYGDVSRHEFLERTTWHAGQHARQLMWILEDKLLILPDRPIDPATWTGLPMPDKVWDS